MMLCLVNLRFLATLSKSTTIHSGKSMLTLLGFWPGLELFSKSRNSLRFSFSSNFLSNSAAVMDFFFSFSESSYQNNSYWIYAKHVNGWPNRLIKFGNHLKLLFIYCGALITILLGSSLNFFESSTSIPCLILFTTLFHGSISNIDLIYLTK